MKKIFKFNIYRTGYILGMILVPIPLVLSIWCMFLTVQQKQPMIILVLASCFLYGSVVVCYMFYFYFNKLQIQIDGNRLIYTFPGRNVEINIKEDIVSIRKLFGLNGVGYFVYYKDKKGKKRHIDFTQDLEGSEQLVKFLESKVNVKVQQQGTLAIKDTDKPITKMLKLVFNIVVVLGLLWVLVIWPVMHAWK